jgi:hypothetical protein
LSDTDARDLLGLGLGKRPDLRGLLQRALVFGLALVALHRDAQFRLCDAALLLGAGLGLAQLAFFRRGRLLSRVGFDLLDSDLTLAELRQGLLNTRFEN